MDVTSIAVVVAGLLIFALVSGRLQGSIITAPLAFVVFGYAVSTDGLNLVHMPADHSAIHLLAEFTLILVLFTDAARIDLHQLRRDHDVPMRMLLIGLPLTILGGALTAAGLFPSFTVWEAALLAALLAPTDAALGQSVVSATVVPVRIRQAINVESGLNDGIALPAVLLFAALASASGQAGPEGGWGLFVALQLILGPIVGVVLGWSGARLLDAASQRGWITEAFQGIGILALAILAYVTAELVGGNGFIAAFVGGMAFGNTLRHACEFLFEFMETEGQLLMLITFTIFGATLLPEAIAHADGAIVLYAVLSLTVIRIVPIMISLAGSGLRVPTQLFLGWFGPRGLASILFVLLILDKTALPHKNELLAVTVITVALSALLHGISAAPLARWYGRFATRMGDCEENHPVAEMPLREGMSERDSVAEQPEN